MTQKIISRFAGLRYHLSGWVNKFAGSLIAIIALIVGPLSCTENAATLQPAKIFFLAPDKPSFREEMTKVEVLLRQKNSRLFKAEFVALPHYQTLEYANLAALLKTLSLQNPIAIVTSDMNVPKVALTNGISIPFVTGGLADPVALGISKSKNGTRTSVTGYTKYVNIDERRLAILREISPSSRRIGVFYDDIIMAERKARNGSQSAYVTDGADVVPFKVELLSEVLTAIANSKSLGIDSWYIQLMPHNYRKADAIKIIEAINRLKLPAIYENMSFVESGGLAAYESVLFEPELIWAQNLQLLLDGVKAENIPFAEPRHFFFSLNTDQANRLKLKLEPKILRQVDRTFPCAAKPPLNCSAANPQKF